MANDGDDSDHKDSGECTCGTYYGLESDRLEEKDESDRTSRAQRTSSETTPAVTSSLDASFVHLPESLLLRAEETSSPQSSARNAHDHLKPSPGFLDSFSHLAQLEQAATSVENPPAICLDCVQRVERSLDADTERLDDECRAYRQAVCMEEERIQGLKRALQIAAASTHGNLAGDGGLVDFERTEQTYRTEIQLLEEACEQHEEELRHLSSLQKEQAVIAVELDRLEYATEEEQNALELEARAFDNDQEQLLRKLVKTQAEVEQLSSPRIRLPAMLMDLRVDRERGLRYPLINELRLAYRPKGDVQWNEIQTAWSLAAQLLLVIGTIFDFQSPHWKIVPLSHCAKLMYSNGNNPSGNKRRVVVYNLGHSKTNGSRALLAWNVLLFQVIQHATVEMKLACESGVLDAANVPPLPFDITTEKIGNIVLSSLNENDDGGWSRAIHCMASNLLWLSESASAYVLQQVLLATSVAA